MAYLKINNIDYSKYVNSLKVNKASNYTSQTNAAGNTVADFINSKRAIEVGFIALNDAVMSEIQEAIDNFNVTVSFRDPKTNALTDLACIIPDNEIEYYTIQINKVMYKAFTLTFTEL